jgi:hypothetical protein
MASSSRSYGLYFCRAGLSCFEKKARGCKALLTSCYSTAPMAGVEASVTSASGAGGSGYASRVACDKLALHSLNALRSSGVQVMGREPLTLGPDRTSCSGACVAAAWGRNRL